MAWTWAGVVWGVSIAVVAGRLTARRSEYWLIDRDCRAWSRKGARPAVRMAWLLALLVAIAPLLAAAAAWGAAELAAGRFGRKGDW